MFRQGVVAYEATANFRGSDSYDVVFNGVVGRVAPKNVDSDEALFHKGVVATKRAIDHILQEAGIPVTIAEEQTAKDARELLFHGAIVDLHRPWPVSVPAADFN